MKQRKKSPLLYLFARITNCKSTDPEDLRSICLPCMPGKSQFRKKLWMKSSVPEVIRGKSQLRLIYNFMSEQSAEDYTEFVKREYGIGGQRS